MKALILNSGTGARMGVITNELPKCVVPNNCKRIIGKQIDKLLRNGIFNSNKKQILLWL